MNRTVFVTIIILLFGGALYLVYSKGPAQSKKVDQIPPERFGRNYKAIVYKSPNCGCCVGYAKELKKWGFEVEVISREDMAVVKREYGIPPEKQSCHTVVIEPYFIEGHVPMEAIAKLLQEKPEIDGIGLPRMPSGTPGMPGPKRAPFEIYQVKGGSFAEFMTL